VLFLTDSIVIGSLVNVSQVTYYAIPGMIVEYLEKLIWAIVAVLVPIISSQEAIGNKDKNQELYLIGTRYSLILISPIVFVLFLVGDDFIGMWMGPDYATPSGEILCILLVGHIFFLSQFIAHGILKGISRHKILAFILCGEAVINLFLSIYLAPRYGIKGVAVGTVIPLLIVNIFLLPYYTCRELKINYLRYLVKGIFQPLLYLVIPLFIVAYYFDIKVDTYVQLILFSAFVAIVYGLVALLFQLEKPHAQRIYRFLQRK
jgi:O-antigen/teichoic acid export membrane protein